MRALHPWAMTVPNGWSLVPARTMARPTENPVADSDGTVTVFRDGQVTLRELRRTDGFTESFKEIGYHGIRTGELAIHSMDAFAGAMGIAEADGKVSPVVHTYSVDQDDVRYLNWQLKALAGTGYIQSLSKGIRERSTAFGPREFRRLPMLRPPLEVQKGIADFLDTETAEMDAMIAAQQALIDSLADRKRAVIDATVFAGIPCHQFSGRQDNIEFRYKPIGFPMLALTSHLELMPNHWGTIRFRPALERLDERNVSGTATLMSLTTQGVVRPRSMSVIQQEPAEESLPKYLLVEPGDLVVNPMWLGGGAVGVSRVRGAVSPDYRVFRSRGILDPTYLHHLVRSTPFRHQYELFTRASTTFDRRVQQGDIDNLPLPVPPLAEQVAIANYLDVTVDRMDKMIRAAEESTELIRERRAAVISAAVTGRLDPSTGIEHSTTVLEEV